jgi:hypothetical protein
LHEFLQVFFTLGLPHKRPQRYARTADARIIQTDLALPFGSEKIVERAKLFGLGQLAVIKQTFGAGIGDKRIKKPISLEIVVPDMSPTSIWDL